MLLYRSYDNRFRYYFCEQSILFKIKNSFKYSSKPLTDYPHLCCFWLKVLIWKYRAVLSAFMDIIRKANKILKLS